MSELHFLNNLLMLPKRENQGLTPPPPFGSNFEIKVGCITDSDICLFSFLFAWRQTEVVNLHLTLLSCFLPRSSPLPPPSATSPCIFSAPGISGHFTLSSSLFLPPCRLFFCYPPLCSFALHPPPSPSSKYRPTSEQHNDNFSLSTIAEGSHPNVRKLCDTPPNVPHARALAYYDNIICQVTWFSPLLHSPLFSASPWQPCPDPQISPLPL